MQTYTNQIMRVLSDWGHTTTKTPHITFTLGRIVHNTFVSGVAESQYKRILRKLNSNKAWDKVGTSDGHLHVASDSNNNSCVHQYFAGNPLDAQCCVSLKQQKVLLNDCHTFQHKRWRFVVGILQSIQTQDRDDDRPQTYQVQVQLTNNQALTNNKYLAESGLMLVQDLCDMCLHCIPQGGSCHGS